uniref:Uncharacterized protein n=1 Tax=Rhizophora mucronata TaxID=61149 RepID=A0A2P2NA53_RHIMU
MNEMKRLFLLQDFFFSHLQCVPFLSLSLFFPRAIASNNKIILGCLILHLFLWLVEQI